MASRDILEPIQRQVVGEFGDDHLSKEAGSRDAAAYRTSGSLGGDYTVAAVRAGVLRQNVDVHFKVGRDELQDACLILADACLGFSAVRADFLGLGQVVLDANLRQLIVVWLTWLAFPCWCAAIPDGGLGRQGSAWGRIKLKEMSLARRLDQPFPPRTKNVAAEKLDLPTQVIDDLLVFLDSLLVEFGGLIECGAMVVERGLKFGDLLSEVAQQVLALVRISGP
jgi:hypothetical protein